MRDQILLKLGFMYLIMMPSSIRLKSPIALESWRFGRCGRLRVELHGLRLGTVLRTPYSVGYSNIYQGKDPRRPHILHIYLLA